MPTDDITQTPGRRALTGVLQRVHCTSRPLSVLSAAIAPGTVSNQHRITCDGEEPLFFLSGTDVPGYRKGASWSSRRRPGLVAWLGCSLAMIPEQRCRPSKSTRNQPHGKQPQVLTSHLIRRPQLTATPSVLIHHSDIPRCRQLHLSSFQAKAIHCHPQFQSQFHLSPSLGRRTRKPNPFSSSSSLAVQQTQTLVAKWDGDHLIQQ